MLPDGVAVPSGCGGFPTHGSRWAEVTSTGMGPGHGPAGLYAAQLRRNVTVPAFSGGQTKLSVDWLWMTFELQDGSTSVGAPCPCNDYSEIVLFGPAVPGAPTGVISLLYVDTYSPYVITPGNTCPSLVAGSTLPNYAVLQTGGVESASAVMPAGWIGQQVTLYILTVNGGDNQFESSLYVDNRRFEGSGGPFSLTATTTGGGAGDLLLDIQGVPAGAFGVLLLASATPAPGGLGSGPFFGLVPDTILQTMLGAPPAPLSVIHFPVTANPYAAGPISVPAGSFAALAGQTWETTALAYALGVGLVEQSNFQSLSW